MRTTFLVGRVTRSGAEMVMVDRGCTCPIPGPWTLKALVRPTLSPPPCATGVFPRVH